MSKLNTYRDGMRVIRKMLQLYKNYKPMKFFGLLCVLLVLVALLFMLPVLVEFIQTGMVPRFPTLIVCGFMIMAGIQAFFAGMILDVLAAKDRRDFEYRLAKISVEKRGKVD